MILNVFAVTAAALAGVDLAANERNNVSSKPRVIRGIALVGSVAINDFWVDAFIGSYFVGRFFNTNIATNAIDMSADVIPLNSLFVPPGDKIALICGVNAGAGDINVAVY